MDKQIVFHCLDLVDVVQQIIALFYFINDEFVANEENVGQILQCMDVTKSFPCHRYSFATLDVRVVYQVEHNDGHYMFCMSLVIVFHLGSILEGGISKYSSTWPLRSTENNPISNFNL